MANNCYRSKIPPEARNDQEERLASRHIQTLEFLQEIVQENKQLKAKVEELKTELSSRETLDQLAANSKARITQFQEECLRKIDYAQEELKRKHNEEMMRLVAGKLESENEWLQESEQMKKQLAALEKHNAILVDQVEKLRKHNMNVDSVNTKLDQTLQEVEELRQQNEKLKTENIGFKADAEKLQSYESKCEILTMELKDANQKNKELKFKISKLERELSSAVSVSEDTNSDKEKLKKRLSQMNKETDHAQRRGVQQKQQLGELQSRLLEKEAQLRVEQEERERLVLLVDTLSDELQRARLQVEQQQQQQHLHVQQAIGERQSFKEYVMMKREIMSLREENDALKGGKMKHHQSLPKLTSESPETRDKLHSKNSSVDSKEKSRPFKKTYASISSSNFSTFTKK